ncbi:MAG: ribonuclease P protein component [Halothiobacillaceae bacterium]|nr:ribonuclease P protein component [Halothiobacillaceae bacterium]
MNEAPLAGAGFDRSLRLTRPKDFSNVFADARRQAARGVTVLFRENASGKPRIGFAIAKRQVRRAHERNRIRRIGRESFRHRVAGLPSVDMIVLVRADVLKLDGAELRRVFDRILDRVREQCTQTASRNPDQPV